MKLALIAIAASSIFGLGVVAPAAPAQETPKDVSFKENVLPIMKKNCIRCHGADDASKGLRLDTYENTMKGTRYAKVVKPNKSAESVIVKAVKKQPGAEKMPPGKKSLSEADIKTIVDWIDQGAKNN